MFDKIFFFEEIELFQKEKLQFVQVNIIEMLRKKCRQVMKNIIDVFMGVILRQFFFVLDNLVGYFGFIENLKLSF